MLRKARAWGSILTLLTFTCATTAAQTATVFATGLRTPSKLVLGPNGTLLVTEADTTPNSGRISVIDSRGARRTLIDGLPSGLSAPGGEIDGPNGLALAGRVLYIANGEGDGFVVGPRGGSIVPNPAGPSSPIFATIIQATFSADLDKLPAGFSLAKPDHLTLLDGNTVTLTSSGETATLKLLSAFRPGIADPGSIYRNCHLYGLTLLPAQPNSLFVADAGNDLVWTVDLTTGRARVLSRIAPTPNPIAPIGPPVSSAVPTSVKPYGDNLLVSLLSGAPFVPGASRVMEMNSGSGNAAPLITDLSSAIDVLWRPRSDGRGEWFVLEYSTNLGSQNPGRLRAFNSPLAPVVLPTLRTPSSMALDDAGNLYIADRSGGSISVVNVGR